MLEELGWSFQAALTSLDSGPIELLAGAPAAAERELRRDYEALHAMGERNYITTVAAFLAEALYRQERYEDADTLAAFSAEVAAADDLGTQILWRGVRAKLSARTGSFDEAARVASQEVELSRRSDSIVGQADALMDLAEVMRIAGRGDDAATATTEALRLYERKGAIVSADLARAFIAGVAGAVPTSEREAAP